MECKLSPSSSLPVFLFLFPHPSLPLTHPSPPPPPTVHHYDLLSPTGTLSSTVLLGQISLFHVRDDIVDPVSLTIDEAKLHPVARMGGITYARATSTFEIPRPSWKAEEGTEEMRKVLEGEKE